jgi:hypothetical protein
VTPGPPGRVGVRLSGDPAGIEAAEAVLAAGSEILARSGPHPNRRDPGVRVYLTIRVPPAAPSGPGCRS